MMSNWRKWLETWSLFIDASPLFESRLKFGRCEAITFPNHFITINWIDAQFKCAPSNVILGISFLYLFSIWPLLNFFLFFHHFFFRHLFSFISHSARMFSHFNHKPVCRSDSNIYCKCMCCVPKSNDTFILFSPFSFSNKKYFSVDLSTFSVRVLFAVWYTYRMYNERNMHKWRHSEQARQWEWNVNRMKIYSGSWKKSSNMNLKKKFWRGAGEKLRIDSDVEKRTIGEKESASKKKYSDDPFRVINTIIILHISQLLLLSTIFYMFNSLARCVKGKSRFAWQN